MTVPTPTEFWTFNNTLLGLNGNTLASPDGLPHYVTGKVSQAWDVGNSATRILRQLPGPMNPSGSDFTVSWWIYISDIDNIDVSQNWSVYDGTSLQLAFALNSFTECTLTIAGVTANGLELTNEFHELIVAGWNHLVVRVVAGISPEVWVNGWLANNNSSTDSQPAMISPNLYVGGNRLTSAYSDPFDSFGFWHQALTDGQIAELYNSGFGWEPTPATYAAFTINDGLLAGRYIVVKTG